MNTGAPGGLEEARAGLLDERENAVDEAAGMREIELRDLERLRE